jgi:hypothetical protein
MVGKWADFGIQVKKIIQEGCNKLCKLLMTD